MLADFSILPSNGKCGSDTTERELRGVEGPETVNY